MRMRRVLLTITFIALLVGVSIIPVSAQAGNHRFTITGYVSRGCEHTTLNGARFQVFNRYGQRIFETYTTPHWYWQYMNLQGTFYAQTGERLTFRLTYPGCPTLQWSKDVTCETDIRLTGGVTVIANMGYQCPFLQHRFLCLR